MSYYTGQGDYYSGKGDPGLFGFLGGVVSKVTGVASKVLPGPLGIAASAVSRVTGGRAQATPVGPPVPFAATPPSMGGALGRIKTAGQALVPGGVEPMACAAGNGCGSGYHLNKAYSYKYGAEKGTYCVKNRSMNPANPKALRRAIRREKAFIGLARTALRGTGYKVSRTASYASKKRR